MIRLVVNGVSSEFEADMTVASLLDRLGTLPERVAVELNLQILDQQEHSRTVLKDGDHLEIIRFVGGGRGKGQREKAEGGARRL